MFPFLHYTCRPPDDRLISTMRNAFTACGRMRKSHDWRISVTYRFYGVNISPRFVQAAVGGWFYRVTISRICTKPISGKIRIKNEWNQLDWDSNSALRILWPSLYPIHQTHVYVYVLLTGSNMMNRMLPFQSRFDITWWTYFWEKNSKYYLSNATCRLLGPIKARPLWSRSLWCDCQPRLFLR